MRPSAIVVLNVGRHRPTGCRPACGIAHAATSCKTKGAQPEAGPSLDAVEKDKTNLPALLLPFLPFCFQVAVYPVRSLLDSSYPNSLPSPLTQRDPPTHSAPPSSASVQVETSYNACWCLASHPWGEAGHPTHAEGAQASVTDDPQRTPPACTKPRCSTAIVARTCARQMSRTA